MTQLPLGVREVVVVVDGVTREVVVVRTAAEGLIVLLAGADGDADGDPDEDAEPEVADGDAEPVAVRSGWVAVQPATASTTTAAIAARPALRRRTRHRTARGGMAAR